MPHQSYLIRYIVDTVHCTLVHITALLYTEYVYYIRCIVDTVHCTLVHITALLYTEYVYYIRYIVDTVHLYISQHSYTQNMYIISGV